MPGGTAIVDNGSWAMDSALMATGVSAAQQNPRFANIDGSGITTVIIDTGIDLDHPFFGPDANLDGIADRIVFQYDFADGDPNASDIAGHGSHVSGMIGSQDAVYYGVAQGTDLIALKVFEDSGKGYFSYLEQALQWVIANQDAYHIGVVNLSLGDGGIWTDTLSRYGIGDELAALADMDVIMVGAAGNYYASRLGLAYPASDPAVLAVGATYAADFGGPWRISTGATDYVTGEDHICSFSQRDGALLDTFAPGARFNNANATGGVKSMQGTSQAAAFVSGVAALSQQVALQELGRGLTTGEFALLLQETGDIIVDGDDEIDNVLNSGLEYMRINFQALAERILTLDQVPAGGETTPGDGSGSDNLMQQAAPGVHQVPLTAGAAITELDFGNFRFGEISGVKFEDVNGDGVREAGEPGLAGWTIYLDADGNGALDAGEVSAVTAAGGAYAFTDLGPGIYRIREVMQSGWVQTAPAGGYYDIAMTSGLSATDRDFGNQRLNVAPVNTVPGTQTINEDTILTLSGGNGNRISVTDADVGSAPVQVTLAATHGLLTLSGTAGLAFTAGDGSADGTMGFTGTLAAINAALDGLQFAPSVNFNGSANLTLTTNDLGNTGAGSPLSDIDTMALTITPVNDLPVAKNDNVATVKNLPVIISVLANDTDADGDPLVIGSFTQASHGIVVNSGNGRLTYTPTPGWTGTDSFTYTASDGQGVSAAGNVNITCVKPPNRGRSLPPPPPPPPPPAPLLAASAPTTPCVAETVTAENLAPIAAEAMSRWGSFLDSSGNTIVLDKVEFKIANLPDMILGQTIGNTIVIDTDAAGFGWFIDSTPADNREFGSPNGNGEGYALPLSPAAAGMDLLTAVLHEFGHVLGFDHQAQGVMEARLQKGERLSLTGARVSDNGPAPCEACGPVSNDDPALPAPARWFLVFDEAKGELVRPGFGLPRPDPRDLKFYPSQWDGREDRESSDDWIIDYRQRKLHG